MFITLLFVNIYDLKQNYWAIKARDKVMIDNFWFFEKIYYFSRFLIKKLGQEIKHWLIFDIIWINQISMKNSDVDENFLKSLPKETLEHLEVKMFQNSFSYLQNFTNLTYFHCAIAILTDRSIINLTFCQRLKILEIIVHYRYIVYTVSRPRVSHNNICRVFYIFNIRIFKCWVRHQLV